jgi:hypothetical protein
MICLRRRGLTQKDAWSIANLFVTPVVPRQPTTGAPTPTTTLFADRRRCRLLAKLGPIANDARRILVEIIPFTVILCGIIVFEAQEVRNGE